MAGSTGVNSVVFMSRHSSHRDSFQSDEVGTLTCPVGRGSDVQRMIALMSPMRSGFGSAKQVVIILALIQKEVATVELVLMIMLYR